MNFWPALAFGAKRVEIATLVFEDIFIQTQATQKLKKNLGADGS